MKKLASIIGPALLALLLTACSAVQTGYNNADTLLYWSLDDYVDFNKTQTETVRTGLKDLHDWHRREELPAYAALLRELQQAAPHKVSAEQVCVVVDQARHFTQTLAAQSAELLARLATSAQPEQLQRLARQFDKHNLRWREQWLDDTPEALLQRRYQRALDRYEDFYGRLEPAQRKLLRVRLAGSGYDPKLAWAERLRRQQDWLRTLQEQRNNANPSQVKAQMLLLLERSLAPPEPDMRAGFESLLRYGCQTLAELHNSTSPGQKQHLGQKLQDYENDLRALIAAN